MITNRKSLQSAALLLGLAGLAVLLPVSDARAQPAWLKKAREQAQQAAKKAQSEWHKAQPKMKRALGQAEQGWQHAAPRIKKTAEGLRNNITRYAPTVRRAAHSVQENLRQLSPEIRRAAGGAQEGWNRLEPEIQRGRIKAAQWYGRHEKMLAQVAAQAIRQYGPAVERTLRDPETRQKALEALGVAITVHRQFEQFRHAAVQSGVEAAFQLPVRTASGQETLAQLARQRLVGRFPGLAGTDIADDPAAAVTALVTSDRGYFLTKCKFVKTPTGPVSIVQAIKQSSSLNTDKAMKCLDLLDATESVSNAVAGDGDSLDAIDKTAKLLADVGGD